MFSLLLGKRPKKAAVIIRGRGEIEEGVRIGIVRADVFAEVGAFGFGGQEVAVSVGREIEVAVDFSTLEP